MLAGVTSRPPEDRGVDLGGRPPRGRGGPAAPSPDGGARRGRPCPPPCAAPRRVSTWTAPSGQAGQLDQPGAEVLGRVAGRAHDEPIVVAGGGRVDARRGQRDLDGVEVDAQPERLHEPRAPPDHLEHVVGRVVAAEVARRQLVDGRAEREVVAGSVA